MATQEPPELTSSQAHAEYNIEQLPLREIQTNRVTPKHQVNEKIPTSKEVGKVEAYPPLKPHHIKLGGNSNSQLLTEK